MKKHKLIGRMFLLLSCLVLVVCSALPAFAAESPTPLDGYIYVGSFSFSNSDFTLDNEVYSTAGFSASGLSRQEADVCAVSFCGEVLNLDWFSFTSPDGAELAGIGNLHLYDPDLTDNGYGFSIVLCKSDKTRNTFSCTSGFYDEYVCSTDDTPFNISFAVPEPTDDPVAPDVPHKHFTKSILSDVSTIFNSAINMVGTVATTVVSHPILYLPIIVGLCGIGVAFFNRLKQ